MTRLVIASVGMSLLLAGLVTKVLLAGEFPRAESAVSALILFVLWAGPYLLYLTAIKTLSGSVALGGILLTLGAWVVARFLASNEGTAGINLVVGAFDGLAIAVVGIVIEWFLRRRARARNRRKGQERSLPGPSVQSSSNTEI